MFNAFACKKYPWKLNKTPFKPNKTLWHNTQCHDKSLCGLNNLVQLSPDTSKGLCLTVITLNLGQHIFQLETVRWNHVSNITRRQETQQDTVTHVLVWRQIKVRNRWKFVFYSKWISWPKDLRIIFDARERRHFTEERKANSTFNHNNPETMVFCCVFRLFNVNQRKIPRVIFLPQNHSHVILLCSIGPTETEKDFVAG